MKRILVLFLLLAMPGLVFAQDKVLKMSTTTSTQSSGLLDVLLPEFKKDTGIDVKVVAKGTGAAIRDGVDGNVDVIFVHDPAREEKFVADGFGTKRYYVMYNDFLIIGPAADPAGAKGADAAESMKKIAMSEAVFVSRGDDSGTHAKEQALWKATGLSLKEEDTVFKGKTKEVTFKAVHPEGMKMYMSIGQGMGKALTFTEEKQGYTITDRGTYVQYKYGRPEGLDLEPISEGDKNLFNPYGVIPVNPEKHPHVRFDLADTFAKWVVSERGQKVIGDYKLLDKQLFFPDAK
ncbi:MAG: tungsten ABC transporter substrate-binding protein [Deltaproteobacteria bacterium HGW-Deltaproteobacteria-18]|jgi:tungstate transport system substrate-binding protein|nr:MAG: tungsten ABC transporter substrate-binding protein [Deltaproteobacteria bacterium HGW-Deltaproteobacteria-18]